MSNIFNFSTLSRSRIYAITAGNHGSYTFNFTRATADRLDQLSTGFPRAALEAMAGHFVVMESRGEYGRLNPVPEQFPEAIRPLLEGASFNKRALFDYIRPALDNGLFESTRVAICLDCGKTFTAIPASHTCGAVECACCGRPITNELETRLNKCAHCIMIALGKIYDYHHRPLRLSPLFEKDEARGDDLHMGAEIEIDGCNRGDSFDDDDAQAFSAILNTGKRPFVEFEHDSSLDGGIECITQPTTFAGLWKMRDKLRAFYNKAYDLDGDFSRANGLHFHLDRAFFGRDAEEAGKACVLIDLMVYKFYDFFMAISRRERGVTRYASKKEGVTGLYSAFKNVGWQEHFLAVNGSGSNTIELRFFGGHIATGDDFLAAADIAQAIAVWAKKTTIAGAANCTPADLVKYLRKPENVLAFVNGAIPERAITADGEAGIKAFKEAIEARLARKSARREEV